MDKIIKQEVNLITNRFQIDRYIDKTVKLPEDILEILEDIQSLNRSIKGIEMRIEEEFVKLKAALERHANE